MKVSKRTLVILQVIVWIMTIMALGLLAYGIVKTLIS